MLRMGRRTEGEAGLGALLARADGTCQGFEPVLEKGKSGDLLSLSLALSLTHTIYLTGLIFIQRLWRFPSDVSGGGGAGWNEEEKMKRGISGRFEREKETV